LEAFDNVSIPKFDICDNWFKHPARQFFFTAVLAFAKLKHNHGLTLVILELLLSAHSDANVSPKVEN